MNGQAHGETKGRGSGMFPGRPPVRTRYLSVHCGAYEKACPSEIIDIFLSCKSAQPDKRR